jgi:hypothetical protein
VSATHSIPSLPLLSLNRPPGEKSYPQFAPVVLEQAARGEIVDDHIVDQRSLAADLNDHLVPLHTIPLALLAQALDDLMRQLRFALLLLDAARLEASAQQNGGACAHQRCNDSSPNHGFK